MCPSETEITNYDCHRLTKRERMNTMKYQKKKNKKKRTRGLEEEVRSSTFPRGRAAQKTLNLQPLPDISTPLRDLWSRATPEVRNTLIRASVHRGHPLA